MKLDDKSLNITHFTCQFGSYMYVRLPIGTGPTGDMFQCKIDENSNTYQMHLLLDVPPFTNKNNCNHPRHYELIRQFLTSHCRSMQTSVKTDISKGRFDIEQDIPRAI